MACSGASGRTGGRTERREAADAAAALRSRSKRPPPSGCRSNGRAELSGTLVSPDQAKVSSEVAGIIRDVPVQLGTEVRAGDALVRWSRASWRWRSSAPTASIDRVEASWALPGLRAEAAPQTKRSHRSARRWPIATTPKAAYDRAVSAQWARPGLSQVDRDTADTRGSRSWRRTTRPPSTTFTRCVPALQDRQSVPRPRGEEAQ